jgi:hypothetical protein
LYNLHACDLVFILGLHDLDGLGLVVVGCGGSSRGDVRHRYDPLLILGQRHVDRSFDLLRNLGLVDSVLLVPIGLLVVGGLLGGRRTGGCSSWSCQVTAINSVSLGRGCPGIVEEQGVNGPLVGLLIGLGVLVVLEVLIVVVVRVMQQGNLNRDIGKSPRRLAAPVMQRLAKRDDPSDMTCSGTLLLSSAFLGVLLPPGWNVFSAPFVTASG